MTTAEQEHERKLLIEAIRAGNALRAHLMKKSEGSRVFDFTELRQLGKDILICERELARIDNASE